MHPSELGVHEPHAPSLILTKHNVLTTLYNLASPANSKLTIPLWQKLTVLMSLPLPVVMAFGTATTET